MVVTLPRALLSDRTLLTTFPYFCQNILGGLLRPQTTSFQSLWRAESWAGRAAQWYSACLACLACLVTQKLSLVGLACPLSSRQPQDDHKFKVILGYLRELETRLGYKSGEVEGGRGEKRGEERGQKRWGWGTKERQGC